MLDHDKLKTLPDGDLKAFLKELERDAEFIREQLLQRWIAKQDSPVNGKIYKCTVCKINPVDAENGYDTCSTCNP